jgi:hypothetical protein
MCDDVVGLKQGRVTENGGFKAAVGKEGEAVRDVEAWGV